MSGTEEIDDGGTAFPAAYPTGGSTCGMSLLDWFAGQALANSAIANSNLDENKTALVCYAQAAEMLKVRETFR